ncbi:MAG TPA: IclR family transcriptional regulator [Bryobacteraceae bacterium]|nr:IclR family transcriptional regulator [Bryobacteraceae bacterium]
MASGSKAEKPNVYHVQVLDRVFRILDILTESGSGIGLPEIANRLDLHKSTAHRLMMVLEANRFVERNSVSGRYHLGSRLMELGLSAVSQLSVYEIALPHLRALVSETGETAHLAVLRDGQVVSLVSAESTQTLRTPVTVGSRTPAHCTSLGKSMLAFAPEEQVEAYLREQPLKSYTPKTITKISRFKAELKLIRERGYAIDNEEREVGLRCIGAPIWNSSGDVIAAVSIAGPAFRISDEQIPALSKAVVRTATRISTSMGYREMRGRVRQH